MASKSEYEVTFEGQQTFTVEADRVSLEDGALAFYEEPDATRLNSEDVLVRAFNEWRSVRKVG